MISNIEDYKKRINVVQDEIKQDLFKYLNEFDYSNISSDFQVINLKSHEDLKQIYYGSGFYIILTNKNFISDSKQLVIDGKTAIYRGHSYRVRDRIESHLFNSIYKTRKNGTNYTVCLKIDEGINGINIQEDNYAQYDWIVVVHKMRSSTDFIRRQAEIAFDEIYTKPIKSREKIK